MRRLCCEVDLVELAAEFSVCLASAWGWSQQMFQWTFPFCMAGVLSESAADREGALSDGLKLTDAVIAAEEMLRQETAPAGLAGLLQRIAWVEEPFCRELMHKVRMGDMEWIQAAMWKVCAGSSTTQAILESCFAHLRDVAQRQSKRCKMSPYSTWVYATTHNVQGMEQLFPEQRDWAHFGHRFGDSQDEAMASFNRVFKPESSPMPNKGVEDGRFIYTHPYLIPNSVLFPSYFPCPMLAGGCGSILTCFPCPRSIHFQKIPVGLPGPSGATPGLWPITRAAPQQRCFSMTARMVGNACLRAGALRCFTGAGSS